MKPREVLRKQSNKFYVGGGSQGVAGRASDGAWDVVKLYAVIHRLALSTNDATLQRTTSQQAMDTWEGMPCCILEVLLNLDQMIMDRHALPPGGNDQWHQQS